MILTIKTWGATTLLALSTLTASAVTIDDLLADDLKPDQESFEVLWPDVRFYIVGDFNEWQLPTLEDSRGAVDITAKGRVLSGDIDLPAGNHEFAIYTIDEYAPISLQKCIGALPDADPFKIITVEGVVFIPPVADEDGSFPDEWPTMDRKIHLTQNVKVERGIDNIVPFKIKDWTGGSVHFEFNSNSILELSSDDAPRHDETTPDGKVYAVMTIDDGEPMLIEKWSILQYLYETYQDGLGKKISFFYTSENSTEPAPENIWGAPQPVNFSANDIAEMMTGKDFATYETELCKGGYPISFDSDSILNFAFFTDWAFGNMRCAFQKSIEPEIEALVYRDGADEAEHISCTPNPDDNYAIDLEVYGKNLEISFLYNGSECYKLDDWGYPQYPNIQNDGYWTSGRIATAGDMINLYNPIKVNFEDYGKVEIKLYPRHYRAYYHAEESAPSAINEITVSANSAYRYFNLQGQQMSNPSKGIYIEISPEGKSRKIAL